MNQTAKPNATGANDIFFECPACGKSLVVEDQAEGMIVPCPQCRANVIVPPREQAAAKPAAAPTPVSVPVARHAVVAPLAALLHQLQEMQTQRTEISNRIAARLNDVTRDLVAVSRLDATQQQLVAEWAQVVAALDAPHSPPTPAKPGSPPRAT